MTDLFAGALTAPLGGFRIYPNAHHPTEFSHMERQRWRAHPLICWLARYLPINPWVEAEFPRYRDCDPWVEQARGAIYCSLAQAANLRKELSP